MTPPQHEFRCSVRTIEQLRDLVARPLPLGLHAGPVEHSSHRDVYLDTPDGTLRAQGATCRVRVRADGSRILTVAARTADAAGRERLDAEVSGGEIREVLEADSEPARRLRQLVSPADLQPQLELEVERNSRTAEIASSGARFEFVYDVATVRWGLMARTFQDMKVRRLRPGEPSLERLAHALETEHGLRLTISTKLEKGRNLRAAMESEAMTRGVGTGRAVALVAVDDGRIACYVEDGAYRLPVSEGSGEEACRHLLERYLGSVVGDLRLLGTVPGLRGRPELEVWLAHRVRRRSDSTPEHALEWLSLDELVSHAAAASVRHPESLSALMTAARFGELVQAQPAEAPASEVVAAARAARTATPSSGAAAPEGTAAAHPSAAFPVPGAERFLDSELSLLEFNARVLALAEDPRVPGLERLRFVAIVSANLDEFFMVRMGGLRHPSAEVTAERTTFGRTPEEQLAVVLARARGIVARQYQCLRECLDALAPHGIQVRRWADLGPAERAHLGSYFQQQLFPLLTPRAMTLSPGHPFPHIPDRRVTLAIVLKDLQSGPAHFAYLAMPTDVPRFVRIPGSRTFVPIEEVVRGHLDALFPDRLTDRAYAFRITRSGSIELEEATAGNLLQALEEEARRRRSNPVVRVEVERSTPPLLRHLLIRELQFEPGGALSALRLDDIEDVDGLLGLDELRQLADIPEPALRFPPFQARSPLPAERPVWDILRDGDVLVHHPYEDFAATVQRFLAEAADDPDVAAIKMTLYRAGERSPIVDALLRARAGGKEVVVFLELKARFDEERNITWAKRLERAGADLVYGFVGLKTHAKVTLVVRREQGVTRRYVHIGTGNYNAGTARAYADLGLLSADEALGEDLNDLFNALTGTSRPPTGPFNRLLVAPHTLLPGILARIEREADHARHGRGGRIRIMVNGLSDREAIEALYRASQAGVEIDLIVRGICTLRPGVPGLSERIRVISILGRFLEHARIYHFANGGDPEYFIGSADLRPRNLRRRVEVLAPVRDADHRARLDEILEIELHDPTAWELDSAGAYRRRSGPGAGVPGADHEPGAQERLMARAAGAAQPVST